MIRKITDQAVKFYGKLSGIDKVIVPQQNEFRGTLLWNFSLLHIYALAIMFRTLSTLEIF